jgi:hypothetical protein
MTLARHGAALANCIIKRTVAGNRKAGQQFVAEKLNPWYLEDMETKHRDDDDGAGDFRRYGSSPRSSATGDDLKVFSDPQAPQPIEKVDSGRENPRISK